MQSDRERTERPAGMPIDGRKRTLELASDLSEASPDQANLDGRLLGQMDVGAFPEGAVAFGPYPGFVRDHYKEYSGPWFGDHRVRRGGSWATRGRMLRNTRRNFAAPDHRDLFAGFRT